MSQIDHHINGLNDRPEMQNPADVHEGQSGPEKIGAILRKEREKKGLSYDKVSEITKLRPTILEAIENEAWDDLPSSVFVSGFLKSYARALGLEENRIMTHFNEFDSVRSIELEPLVKLANNKKSFFFFP